MHEHGLGTETHPVGGDPSSFRARAQAVHLSKAAKFDRRETEIFRKRTNLRGGAVIVARQEHDSPATVYGRVCSRTVATKWLKPFTSLAPVNAFATTAEDGTPSSSSSGADVFIASR
ncbi:MAG TPA: hypothetical protein VFI32_00270 [Rhodanobacteraceae bacterium]|nr:hypothetical protein [Rhodanobacteraceae bacterium]